MTNDGDRTSAGNGTALIVVDMLNSYDHRDGEQLAENVEPVVGPIASLVDRAGKEDVPIIYVNDNYGHWRSSMSDLADRR